MQTEQLFAAVADGDAQRVDDLLRAEPELARASNEYHLSALQFARYMGRELILDALIAAGPPLDAFDAAQIDRADELAALLVEDPARIAAYSADGFTALHLAAYYGATACVALLLDRGAPVDAITPNFLANMPIHAAAAGRSDAKFAICEMLLRAGADVKAKQHGGFTPLHTAAHIGDRPLAELFLRHGADPAVMNEEGKTAAAQGAAQGNAELATLLRTLEMKAR